DQLPPRSRVEDAQRVVAARQLQVAQGQVDVVVQRGRHVRAEAPPGVEGDEATFHATASRVRLAISNGDARRAGEARVLLVPLIADAAGVEVHLDGGEAAGSDTHGGRGRGGGGGLPLRSGAVRTDHRGRAEHGQ